MQKIRNLKKLSKYVARTAFQAGAKHILRGINKSNTLTETKAQERLEELKRFVLNEKKKSEKTRKIVNAILGDTAIKMHGLNKKLSPQEIKKLRQILAGFYQKIINIDKIKNRKKKGILSKNLSNETSTEIYKIIKNKKIAKRLPFTMLKIRMAISEFII